MKWTEKQQEVISFRGNNLLVSAGAGSGKTAVLIERIKTMLLEEEIPLTAMLIVTFTNAAASEMKEKLQKSLIDEIAKKGNNTVFLREQLNLLNEADISTFNAFALDIVRHYFYIFDLEPDFSICDEVKSELLMQQAMSILFDELFASEDSDFLSFLNNYSSLKNYNVVQNMILDLHKKINVILNPDEWKTNILSNLKNESLNRQMIESYIKNKISQCFLDVELNFSIAADKLSEAGVWSLAEKVKEDLSALHDLEQCFLSGDMDEFGALISAQKWNQLRILKAYEDEKEIYKDIKEEVTSIRDEGKKAFKKLEIFANYNTEREIEYIAESHESVRIILNIVKKYDDIFSKLKREENLVDFADIERFAIRALEDAEIRKEYQEKYEHIFVDEYQDSNHIQEHLINLVSRGNNVFMVGDVKQSIYKFRLAEPEIFTSKQEEYRAARDLLQPAGYAIDLNTNFRSKKNIIDSVNDVFNGLIPNYESEKLNRGVNNEDKYDYPVKLIAVVPDEGIDVDDEVKKLKSHEMEAHAVAAEIKSVLASKIFDQKLQRERDVEPRDIVILMRSIEGKASIYTDILGGHGIDVYSEDGSGYFDTIEIGIFLNLLKTLNNKRNDMAIISLLHSPIMGFSAEELARIRADYKSVPFYYSVVFYGRKNNDDLSGKCKNAVNTIKRWAGDARVNKVDELCRNILGETQFYTYVGGLHGGLQRQANLRFLIDRAAKFATDHSGDLGAFISYINTLQGKRIDISQISLFGEDDNVVRIMTIHKSKGLEYPVVIIAGMGRRLMHAEHISDMNFHKDIGIGISVVNSLKYSKHRTILQEIIKSKNRVESIAEEIRILYVAMTRAKDHLIMVGVMNSMSELNMLRKYAELSQKTDIERIKSFFSMVFPAYFMMDKSPYFLTFSELKPIIETTARNFENMDDIDDGSIFDKVAGAICSKTFNERLNYVYPYEHDTKKEFKQSVSAMLNKNMLYMSPEEISPRFIAEMEPNALEKGIINHKILEHLPIKSLSEIFRKDASLGRSALKTYLSEQVNSGILKNSELEYVDKRGISAFLTSKLCERIAAADRIYREKNFYLMRDDSLIQGTIDLFFIENAEAVLIDYKSNHINDPSDEDELYGVANSYRLQMDIYEEALEATLGIKVKQRYIYLLSACKEIEI